VTNTNPAIAVRIIPKKRKLRLIRFPSYLLSCRCQPEPQGLSMQA
jgi:hypothetical protein